MVGVFAGMRITIRHAAAAAAGSRSRPGAASPDALWRRGHVRVNTLLKGFGFGKKEREWSSAKERNCAASHGQRFGNTLVKGLDAVTAGERERKRDGRSRGIVLYEAHSQGFRNGGGTMGSVYTYGTPCQFLRSVDQLAT